MSVCVGFLGKGGPMGCGLDGSQRVSYTNVWLHSVCFAPRHLFLAVAHEISLFLSEIPLKLNAYSFQSMVVLYNDIYVV